jgi:hypothetical protein
MGSPEIYSLVGGDREVSMSHSSEKSFVKRFVIGAVVFLTIGLAELGLATGGIIDLSKKFSWLIFGFSSISILLGLISTLIGVGMVSLAREEWQKKKNTEVEEAEDEEC